MKHHRNLISSALITGIFLIIVGCIWKVDNTPVEDRHPTVTATQILVKISSTQVLSTQTPSPTISLPAFTKTPTTTRQPTKTTVPTLEPTAIVLTVEELLRTNGDCQAPCFWGISPGKTTYKEALAFFNHLGRKGLKETNANGEVNFYTTSFAGRNQTLPVDLSLNLRSGIVQSVEVYVGGFYRPEIGRDAWRAYSLKSMLQAYGVPTYVGFAIDTPHEGPINSGWVSYTLVMYYELSNVVYYYPGGQVRARSKLNLCPMDPEEYATYLWIYIGKNPFGDFAGWVSLTSASSLSTQDFYTLFVEGNEHTCVELDANAFK